MASIFTIGPVSPDTFTVWSIDNGVAIDIDGVDDTTVFELPAEAA